MTKELKAVYKKYPTRQDCMTHLEKIMWGSEPVCPYCNVSYYSLLKEPNRYHCNSCNISFSVTVKTIFHKTRVDLQKWFLLIDYSFNTKKKLSLRELANEIGVTKDTIQFMLHRIGIQKIENIELLKSIIK